MNYQPGPMTGDDWKRCKSMAIQGHEWGDPEKTCRRVILTLDDCVRDFGLGRIYVSEANGKKHDAEKSWHYPTNDRLGCALDVFFLDKDLRELPDVFFALCRYPALTGIGLYSTWSLRRGGAPKGGVHVDTRPTETRALWLKSAVRYEAFSMENLVRLFG